MFDVDKFIRKISLKNKQKALDKKFEKEGLTDELLEEQIKINAERHKHDIVDENQIVFEKYVQ